MYGIYLIFTSLFLWFCIAGGTLLVSRLYPHFVIARSLGVLGFVLVMFFIEHFVGLGALHGLLPVLIVLAAGVFWRYRRVVCTREFVISEAIFLAAFLYAFLWRFSFPSITPSSERLTDLFFIVNYMDGVTLPPLDKWNPPHAFDYYYAFQHYAAALMGRIFNMGPGETYNFAFAVLGALPLTLIVFIAQRLFKPLSLSRYSYVGFVLLLTAVVASGGNGFTPLLKMTYTAPKHSDFVHPSQPKRSQKASEKRYHEALADLSRDMIIASARYIGSDRDVSMKGDKRVNHTPASIFFPESKPAFKDKKMVLPSENLGYQYFLGDYHPTLGGFFLLTLALALLFALMPQPQLAKSNSNERRTDKLSQAMLTACVPLMLITNTWTMPLLVLLIVGWIIYRLVRKQPVNWVWLMGGGVAVTFLIYPFLTLFLTSSLSTPMDIVIERMRTPFSRFVALQWPVILLIVLGFWEGRKQKIAWFFSLVWLLMLILSEVVYIDDPTAGHFSRTNTVMKWWGWIQVGAFITLGGLLMSSANKVLRWGTMAVLLVITATAGHELQRYWRYSGKYYMGYMEGHRWYTNKATNRQMFEYLEAAPDGVILEPVLDNAYSDTSIYAIFNRKPVLLGWPSHLRTWHGSVPRIWILKDEIDAFYKGEKSDALNWLKSHDIDYVVFSPKTDDKAFDAMNDQIKSEYVWQEFDHSRTRHTGIWVRINK